jgi:hypothetical protein
MGRLRKFGSVHGLPEQDHIQNDEAAAVNCAANSDRLHPRDWGHVPRTKSIVLSTANPVRFRTVRAGTDSQERPAWGVDSTTRSGAQSCLTARTIH